MRNVIFDLDLTLIDTTCLEGYRHSRNWPEAYKHIPETSMYPGISDVLDIIRNHNIKMAIVSTSPRPYVEKLVEFYNIPAQAIVSYHDAKPIKPHPAQMLKALELLGVNADKYNTPRFSDRHNYGGMTRNRYICKKEENQNGKTI